MSTRRTRRTTNRPAVRGVGLLSIGLLGLSLAGSRPVHRVEALVRGNSSAAAAQAVRAHGGTVTNQLAVIDGVVASIDANRIPEISSDPAVTRVDVDASAATESLIAGTKYDTQTQVGSMYSTARLVGADHLWAQGALGLGVGVALIDTGVQPSAFFGPRLVAGADFSGLNNPLADGYGHGTHMAGIIAGSSGIIGSPSGFTGIAPMAKIISVRVANNTGASSLLKILQGVDWVYRNHDLYNIKVANLSMGVPAYADYTQDPLVAATQRLWYSGVAVVASAGNIGPGMNLTSPAIDPTIIAVGAVDTKGTMTAADDAVATFSAGAATAAGRAPTVVVPARSVQGIMATGSVLSKAAVLSGIGTSFIKGTGTSQAAAIVSGEAALMLSANIFLGPTDIKQNLCVFADDRGWDRKVQGCGVGTVEDMAWWNLSTSYTWEGYPQATASPLTADTNADLNARVYGQQGASWQGASWQGASWQGSSWQGLPF